MPSILLCTSGNPMIGADILFRLGYTPSFTSSKNEVTLRRVSSMVLSLRIEIRSMAAELVSSGLRKSIQSMKPPDGKPSSNIMMSLISSVRRSLLRIFAALVEKVSVAVLSTAYDVEHLSEMIRLIRSNPSFCSNLESIFLLSSMSPICKDTKIILYVII